MVIRGVKFCQNMSRMSKTLLPANVANQRTPKLFLFTVTLLRQLLKIHHCCFMFTLLFSRKYFDAVLTLVVSQFLKHLTYSHTCFRIVSAIILYDVCSHHNEILRSICCFLTLDRSIGMRRKLFVLRLSGLLFASGVSG